MTALFDIVRRSTEAKYEKAAETVLGAFHVFFRVHGSEDVIAWDLPVESGDEPPKAIFSDGGIYLVIFHLYFAGGSAETIAPAGDVAIGPIPKGSRSRDVHHDGQPPQ